MVLSQVTVLLRPRSMKPSNVQTSPGGKSNTKKNNILNNNNNNPESNQKNFPQIRKPTLTLAEVEKQINAEKQAKNKVRNSASTVVTNQTNNSNLKNSSILIQNPQASSIKSSKQNLTTATLATATSATTSNPRLLQSNTPSSNIVTKKSQSRPNKRKQTFSTKSQNDSKQQNIINEQATKLVNLNQLVAVDVKPVNSQMSPKTDKQHQGVPMKSMASDQNQKQQLTNLSSLNNQNVNSPSQQTNIQTGSSTSNSNFLVNSAQQNISKNSNQNSNLQNKTTVGKMNSPGGMPGSPNILVTQTNADGVVQQMMSVPNISEIPSIMEKFKKNDSPPKDGNSIQINPRLLEQARRLPQGFKRDSEGRVHFSEGKTYTKKTNITNLAKNNNKEKISNFKNSTKSKVSGKNSQTKGQSTFQIQLAGATQLGSPIAGSPILSTQNPSLIHPQIIISQNSKFIINQNACFSQNTSSNKADTSKRTNHKFTKMEPKLALKDANSKTKEANVDFSNHNNGKTSSSTKSKSQKQQRNSKSDSKSSNSNAKSNSDIDSTLNFLSKPETPTSSPGEVDYSSPHVLFSNQPKLNIKSKKDKSDSLHPPSSKKMKMSIFRTRNDLRVKTRASTTNLRTDKLERELSGNSKILNNGVKRVNFVRQLLVNNCNNLHLTYCRLKRIRNLLSSKAPAQIEISENLIRDIQQKKEESLETKCGLNITTLPVIKADKTRDLKNKKTDPKADAGQSQFTKMSDLFPRVPVKNQHRELAENTDIIETIKTPLSTTKIEIANKSTQPASPVVQPLRSARLAQKRTLREEKENNENSDEHRKPLIPNIILPDPPLELTELIMCPKKLNEKMVRVFEESSSSVEHLIDSLDVLMIRYKDACNILMEAAGNVEFQGSGIKGSGSNKRNLGTFVNCKKGTERKARWSADNNNKTQNYKKLKNDLKFINCKIF